MNPAQLGLLRPAGGTPLVRRRAGQTLARTELSKAIYHRHESLAQRLLDAINRLLNDLYTVGKSFPGGWWSVVALATLTALAVALVLARLGPLARARREAGQQAAGRPPLSAADHRQHAAQLASAGDYAAAILEAVRGIARQLEERGVLSPRLGRTADEIAAEAGLAQPAEAAALHDAARLFDDICYGERPGTADGYALVRSLDTRLQSARPAEPSTSDAAGIRQLALASTGLTSEERARRTGGAPRQRRRAAELDSGGGMGRRAGRERGPSGRATGEGGAVKGNGEVAGAAGGAEPTQQYSWLVWCCWAGSWSRCSPRHGRRAAT